MSISVKRLLEHVEAISSGDKPWMMTASGGMLDLVCPRLEQISLRDVCHHLARLNRFTGAINRDNYSVAQHLITATAIAKCELDNEAAVDRQSVEYYDQLLAVALHDGEEYAFNDLSSPVKRAIAPSRYKWMATNLRRKIYEKYGVSWDYHNETVLHADLNALVIERYVLLPVSEHWPIFPAPRLAFHDLPKLTVKQAEDGLHDMVMDLIRKRNAARVGGDRC